MSLRARFDRFAKGASGFTGRPSAFVLSVTVIVVWAALGPGFHYSNTWQLVINTATTIVTFLMVFLIQNTQNRDIAATQVKLDELIRATRGAKNALLDLEELDEESLERMRREYEQLAERTRRHAEERRARRQRLAAQPGARATAPGETPRTRDREAPASPPDLPRTR
jgi:low affinity Fe/Cu permease